MADFEHIDEPIAYDMGISTIQRMNYWLWKANEFQFKDDVINWFKALKIIYKDLSPFLKKELKEQEDTYKKIYEEYKSYINGLNNQNKKERYSPPKKIFDLLFDWDMRLRKLMEEYDLLMKKGEKASEAIM